MAGQPKFPGVHVTPRTYAAFHRVDAARWASPMCPGSDTQGIGVGRYAIGDAFLLSGHVRPFLPANTVRRGAR